jgi:hypothetical protein
MRENRTYGSGGKEAGNRLLTLIAFVAANSFARSIARWLDEFARSILSAPTLVGGQRRTAGDG